MEADRFLEVDFSPCRLISGWLCMILGRVGAKAVEGRGSRATFWPRRPRIDFAAHQLSWRPRGQNLAARPRMHPKGGEVDRFWCPAEREQFQFDIHYFLNSYFLTSVFPGRVQPEKVEGRRSRSRSGASIVVEGVTNDIARDDSRILGP